MIIADLVAVELLRHHDHKTYDFIRNNKEYFTGRGPAGPDNRRSLHDRLMDGIPITRREDISELLARMFPAFAAGLPNKFFLHRAEDDILKGRPVNSVEGFDSYFRFSPSTDEVTVVELQEVVKRIDDEEFLTEFMLTLAARKRTDGTTFLGAFLDQLSRILKPIKNIGPAILTALLKLYDRIIEIGDNMAGFYLMDNLHRLGPLMMLIIERMDADELAATVTSGLDDPEVSIASSAYIVAHLGADHGLVWERSREMTPEPALPRERVEDLGKKLAVKIEELGNSDALPITLTIDIVLRVWKTFGNGAAARAWVNRGFLSPSIFLKLAFSLMGNVSSTSPPYRFRRFNQVIDEELFDLENMLCYAKKHVTWDGLVDGDRDDLQRFIEGLEDRLTSK